MLGLLARLRRRPAARHARQVASSPSATSRRVTDRTILGGIAFDADASKHPLIVQVDPRSQRAEAFRSLRTNLQFIDVANPPKSIVVTSSLPGEGKSTTTANLALSLAETGLKVVVIEGDLRRPRLLDYLGFEGSVGLTDVLVGRVEVDDVLQPFGRTGLRLLGAGPIPPNPSELLGSANMEQLVADLAERFDYVLIDAPPLLPVTDAAVLSTIVDGALVVVGAGRGPARARAPRPRLPRGRSTARCSASSSTGSSRRTGPAPTATTAMSTCRTGSVSAPRAAAARARASPRRSSPSPRAQAGARLLTAARQLKVQNVSHVLDSQRFRREGTRPMERHGSFDDPMFPRNDLLRDLVRKGRLR